MEAAEESSDCGCMSRRRKSDTGRRSKVLIATPAATLMTNPSARAETLTFQGKKALVTGGSRGIGKSIVKHLHYLGAAVVAVGRNDADLETLTTDMPDIQLLQLDVTKWLLSEKKLATIGDIDLLVNCAGLTTLGSILNVTEEDFNEIFDTNTKSVVNLIRIISQQMIKRKTKGSIVTITSQSGSFGIKRHGIFGASKAAVEAYSRTAALELAPYDIRVNCVSPAVIMTRTSRKIWGKSKEAKPLLAKIPLKRFGEINEVVHAVLFLLSDKASMITGYCLPIDGGFSAC